MITHPPCLRRESGMLYPIKTSYIVVGPGWIAGRSFVMSYQTTAIDSITQGARGTTTPESMSYTESEP